MIRELRALAPKLLFGSVSETYRTCGQPTCRCHQGERHGPYLHVSYRQDGRTRGYHVPERLRGLVLEGVRAWGRFQTIARELAEHNRKTLGLGASQGSSKKSGKR